ncbi:MAG: NAD(P)-dependent glycerol-3-phosphate dehydrogenase [Acidobacteria bacterium]|nr:MAG: NAD(P)-dependent glycerol-3-phosphate dehydrogenase [Acidobacteriota bacterium]REK04329.1 MAG: NAD(P)-dependent glycerol-3-phosphate dehydrogenase [Acidobacteriota bacterium]
MKSEISVLGAGSFGTALAIHAARAGIRARLWARSEGRVRELSAGVDETYLSGVELPDGVAPTHDLAVAAECELALVAVPSHGFRDVVRAFLRQVPEGRPQIFVSLTKGVEEQTQARMSQVCFEEGVQSGHDVRFAVLSGPSFAEELVAGTPTAAVIATEDLDLAHQLRSLLSAGNLRLYSSSDVVGVEIAGAAKNVVAIAAGAAAGLGFGQNTLAALMTRGLHEVSRLGAACGGRRRTFSGLAGMGDLVLTCTGALSRNRRTGVELARGRKLEEIQAELGMVAEGVKNCRSLAALAHQRGIEMPITEQMVEVLYGGKHPRTAVEELMSRDLKHENE